MRSSLMRLVLQARNSRDPSRVDSVYRCCSANRRSGAARTPHRLCLRLRLVLVSLPPLLPLPCLRPPLGRRPAS